MLILTYSYTFYSTLRCRYENFLILLSNKTKIKRKTKVSIIFPYYCSCIKNKRILKEKKTKTIYFVDIGWLVDEYWISLESKVKQRERVHYFFFFVIGFTRAKFIHLRIFEMKCFLSFFVVVVFNDDVCIYFLWWFWLPDLMTVWKMMTYFVVFCDEFIECYELC